jgi:hypothetical protein
MGFFKRDRCYLTLKVFPYLHFPFFISPGKKFPRKVFAPEGLKDRRKVIKLTLGREKIEALTKVEKFGQNV